MQTPSNAVNSEILPRAEEISELQAAGYWENTPGNLSPCTFSEKLCVTSPGIHSRLALFRMSDLLAAG